MLLCSIPAVIAGCSMQPAFIGECIDDPRASGALVRNADDVRNRGLIAAGRWACFASATARLSQCAQLSTYVAGDGTAVLIQKMWILGRVRVRIKIPRARGKGQASGVPLSSADRHIRDIYRLAVQCVAEMGLQGGFTGL